MPCLTKLKLFGKKSKSCCGKGEKVSELEYCYSTDFESTNFGNKFDFEGEEPGQKLDDDGEDSYLFDFDSTEKYCDYFGLIIQTNLLSFLAATLSYCDRQ